MARKKKKSVNKEELLDMLKKLSNDDNFSQEDKEKARELAIELDKVEIYTKAQFVIAYVIATLLRFIGHYIVSLVLLGLFSSALLLENKFHVFYIPLGISIMFTVLAIISDLLFKIKGSLGLYFMKSIIVIVSFVIINMVHPIFTSSIVLLFYIPLIVIIEELLMYKIIRRKS